MHRVPWVSSSEVFSKHFITPPFSDYSRFINVPEEFHAIIKKGPLLQKKHEAFVYCLHIVPNKIGNLYGYASFPATLSEASFIESENPEFSTIGIQGKWKFDGTLQLVQRMKDIKFCKDKENFFSIDYVKYF
jgi:hypothetical protein